jgi:hypothetical protein
MLRYIEGGPGQRRLIAELATQTGMCHCAVPGDERVRHAAIFVQTAPHQRAPHPHRQVGMLLLIQHHAGLQQSRDDQRVPVGIEPPINERRWQPGALFAREQVILLVGVLAACEIGQPLLVMQQRRGVPSSNS